MNLLSATQRKKLFMCTSFSNLTVLDVVDSVCILDRGQTVCDSNSGATLRGVVQSGLDDLLGCRVESRGSLVQ